MKLKTTMLGTKAEELFLEEFVRSKGYEPFAPMGNKSHSIDVHCFSGNSHCFSLDMKCKSSQMFRPWTGFDKADYNHYKSMDTKEHPVYILFADIKQKEVYGNWLVRLKPIFEEDIVYFELSQMIPYRRMTDEEYQQLKQYEQSNYN